MASWSWDFPVSQRDRILERVRAAHEKRTALAGEEMHIAEGEPVLSRTAGLGASELIDLFEAKAREASATVERLGKITDIPSAVASYLAARNLPTKIVAAPSLNEIPWSSRPLLAVTYGVPGNDITVGVSKAFAAIAETGTLMLLSGAQDPTTLNFLPDSSVVAISADRIVRSVEEAWSVMRSGLNPHSAIPRSVNFITGPSRSGDIEQIIQLGVHGPRRLHILIVDDFRPE